MESIHNLLSSATSVQLGAGVTAIVSVGLVYATSRKNQASSHRYPPGPPKLPLLGNAHNFPMEDWAVVFNDWQKLYGDIVYVQLPGMPFYIINSLEVAQELLNKRAKFNSDRKMGYMITQLMGWNWSPGFINANMVHGRERTMFRRGIGPTKMPLKDPLIERNAQQLVLDLQSVNGNPKDTIVNLLGNTIIELAYGRGIVKDHGAELRSTWSNGYTTICILNGLACGSNPTTSFLAKLDARRRIQTIWCIQQDARGPNPRMAFSNGCRAKAGTLDRCLADDLINEFGTSFEVQDTLANLYFAGVDTTSTAIIRFLHTVFLFPEVARKMQAEIDSVVGRDRLPTVQDRANLPYTNAVWKEALRYKCALPLAIPHSNNEDQIINGYFIPKGSIINPNYGFMLNDPKIWGDPEVFRPERFLSSDAITLPDPTVIVFGFGPRICPGMYFADRTGFHMVATTMALFNINPLPGDSIPHYTQVQYEKSVLRHPVGFNCTFTPRDDKASHLLFSLSLDQ